MRATPEHPPLQSRRHFLKASLAAGLATLAAACSPADPLAHVRLRVVNPDARTGHLLRNPAQIPPPSGTTARTEVVIVGGGISGLSALRSLRKAGVLDIVLLELEAETGGNSVAGSNAITRYPWAAHYLPIPDPRNLELLQFLGECGVVTGYRAGLPVYNEYYLCSDPEERLFMNGFWQEGLVPQTGLRQDEKADIARFFDEVETFRSMRGSDGRDYFCIPLAEASRDDAALELDTLTFAGWLDARGLRTRPLRWYLDYCCMDDYGLPTTQVSAWAGIHYFAGRKGRAANATHADLLTWPEGNTFLMEALRRGNEAHIRTRSLVYRVDTVGGDRWERFVLSVYDAAAKRSYRVACRELVLATPHFIGSRLFGAGMPTPRVAHVPWVVANLTLKQLPQSSGQGQPLCWDNVIYGSRSVGYVNARQQQPGMQEGPVVITYYLPLASGDPGDARRLAFSTDARQWLDGIVAELSMAHPDFAKALIEAEIRVWGHGMAGPLPGFRTAAPSAPPDGPIFAHTDYSGISIFEEAFYQGHRAAEAILKRRS